MPVSSDDLQKLKDPFGEFIADGDVSEQRIRAAINGTKLVVTVGDATTDKLTTLKIIPDIAVIDKVERRSLSTRQIDYQAKELRCANPRGTITQEAVAVLQQAIWGDHPVMVIVDGEEDLLVLPLVQMLPEGSVVLYGQPLEGLVVVNITESKKAEAKDLMDRIGIN
jgi:uncharacterized protein (UPF0218 family)